ncbi:hypothetical protein N9V10_03985 [Candidatus Marinimicrobia bacterium]|nr:hypothetical protein [Candidatus Neomarinimicrobiota bacterium]
METKIIKDEVKKGLTLRVIMYGLQYKLESLNLLADLKDNSDIRLMNQMIEDLLARYRRDKIFDIDELIEENRLND